MEIELSQPNSLLTTIQNNTGLITPQRSDIQNDLNILCLLHGRKLYNILLDDHDLIHYYDNKIVLKTILTSDNTSVMRIMGKVAESVIARKCEESLYANKLWMFYASGTAVRDEIASMYKAVGTGFKSTQAKHSTVYNPQDTQRDIIWIGEDGFHFPVRGSSSTGARDAGLQVKISTNGLPYLYKDLVEHTYEVPVVYFDLNKDYEYIFSKVSKDLEDESEYSLSERFISVRECDEDAFLEAEYYMQMIQAVADGRLEVDDFINRAGSNETFGSAVMASAFETITNTTLLRASSDRSPLL